MICCAGISFVLMDNGSYQRGDRAAEELQARHPRIVIVHTPTSCQLAQPNRSQANAKLVFRTVLTIDGPEGAGHCVPLKRRKTFNPLVRNVDVSI
jgi:hypothetical protein